MPWFDRFRFAERVLPPLFFIVTGLIAYLLWPVIKDEHIAVIVGASAVALYLWGFFFSCLFCWYVFGPPGDS